MRFIDMNTSVGQIVVEQPNLSRVFDKLGINYCCGGKLSLREACAENGLDPDSVVRELKGSVEIRQADSGSEKDWMNIPLSELCDHMKETYHH